MRSRMLRLGLATKRSITPAPRNISSAKAVMYRVIGTLMALLCLSLPATLDRADGARLAPSSPQFTEEMHDGDPKYYNSRVLYTSEESTVTVHQRQFKGGTGEGGATRWRQGGIIERTDGYAARSSFGPGSWTDGELSPWYVYVGEGTTTYTGSVQIEYIFQWDSRSPGRPWSSVIVHRLRPAR